MDRRTLAIAIAALVVALDAGTAWAQQIDDGTITVIQPKPMLRRHRVSVTPRAGMTVNDALLRQWSVGGTLAYSPTERVFVGGTFELFDFNGALGGVTGAYEDVISATRAVPEVAPLTWYGGVEVGFVPAYGKLVLFNRTIAYIDLYVAAGAGAIDSGGRVHGAGTLAGGTNLYLNRWLGINAEFRDRISVEELPVAGNSFTNTVTSTLGLVVMLPFNFRYTYDEASR